ncbi:ABC-2 family transporter protein [Patescibacteria group bacterium]|nr:ABC-2 family transporter protein [Patescibacteria group bacterium]
MYKYWLIAQLFWQDSLVYRASFLMWRLRSFTSTLISLSVWSAIYQHQSQVFNYSQPAMLSYIFLTAILHSLILSTSLHSLANEIYSGQISFNLLKPINFMGMLISQELADKAINIIFAIGEINLLYLIFKPSFILPPSNTILIFIFWVALGIIIHFIINLLFGTIGFWSPDSWGPKFLFFMLIEFTAGKLYPLDILPQIIQKIISKVVI